MIMGTSLSFILPLYFSFLFRNSRRTKTTTINVTTLLPNFFSIFFIRMTRNSWGTKQLLITNWYTFLFFFYLFLFLYSAPYMASCLTSSTLFNFKLVCNFIIIGFIFFFFAARYLFGRCHHPQR